jgi:hypothetical protein
MRSTGLIARYVAGGTGKPRRVGRLVLLRAARPWAKGCVERLQDFLEKGFKPGRRFANGVDPVYRAGRRSRRPARKSSEEVELAEVQDGVAADRGLEGEVEVLKRLAGGNRAALIRARPPWLSRLSISIASSTSAKRSKDHSSARARSASFGSARAAAGASSARNKCAGSV